MDAIDIELEAAWGRLIARLGGDRRELVRRLRRRRIASAARPLRAWCLGLRASDTRIRHEHTAFFDEDLAGAREAHDVQLRGPGIRELVAPVSIAYPGVRLAEAGRRLGINPVAVRRWVLAKALRVEHDYCRPHGYCGKPCPRIWTDGPLDPNSPFGRRPDELWGSMWQGHGERVPEQFCATLTRVPRTSRRLGRWFGWDWICPGLFGRECGRRAQRLYLPVTVWTLHRALASVPMGEDGREEQELDPDALAAALRDPRIGKRSFACEECWQVQWTTFTDPTVAWNQFVTHISGGLLMGREVPMPVEYRNKTRRRRAFHARIGRAPSRRREQVSELWVTTAETQEQIAAKLGVGVSTVRRCIERLYEQYGVHGRAALARALRRPPPPARVDPVAVRRRERVARLYVAGWSYKQIAADLEVPIMVVISDMITLRRRGAWLSRAARKSGPAVGALIHPPRS